MPTLTYLTRRGELQTYFDRTAVEAWTRLTSDAPLGRIRTTVRAGRDEMRAVLLGRLPADLSGKRLLDAGCGTGAFAVAAAQRGAEVMAIDLSPTLVTLARERAAAALEASARIDFKDGDMLAPEHGSFDHVVAMDSLIHYTAADMVKALLLLVPRTRCSIVFTFAPRTPALTVMHAAGRLLPRGDRAPAIEPVGPAHLKQLIATEPGFAGWRITHEQRIARGFYISQAMELRRS